MQQLPLYHLPEHVRICILSRFDVNGANSEALVKTPQVPLFDGEYSLDVPYGLQFVLIDWHELVRVHLLEQGKADIEAERYCEEHDDTTLDEAEQVLKNAEVEADVVDPDVAETVNELTADKQRYRVGVDHERIPLCHLLDFGLQCQLKLFCCLTWRWCPA